MCYDEFAHFLHLCNMCHARDDEEALRDVFAESASNRLVTTDSLRTSFTSVL